jgi:hypothetical protein
VRRDEVHGSKTLDTIRNIIPIAIEMIADGAVAEERRVAYYL